MMDPRRSSTVTSTLHISEASYCRLRCYTFSITDFKMAFCPLKAQKKKMFIFPSVVNYFPKLLNWPNEAEKDIKPITKIHYKVNIWLIFFFEIIWIDFRKYRWREKQYDWYRWQNNFCHNPQLSFPQINHQTFSLIIKHPSDRWPNFPRFLKILFKIFTSPGLKVYKTIITSLHWHL